MGAEGGRARLPLAPCPHPRATTQDGCHNYIRVLVPRDARTLFACGTNAFNPVCRSYEVGGLTRARDGGRRCWGWDPHRTPV